MDLQNSIVSIVAKSNSTYKYAGTGFFVEGGVILTCVHVVNDAQVTDGRLQFRIEGGQKFYEAEVIAKNATQDICLLKPVNLDVDVPVLRLVASRQRDGHPFKAFGYPQKGGFDGLHADGKIKGWTRDQSGRDALQLSSRDLTHGYSGCPVWDETLGGVVGMVSSGFDFGLDQKLGDAVFAIPSEILKTIDSNLMLHEAAQSATPKGWFYGHRYGDLENFTGRAAEMQMLDEWLGNDKDNLLVLTAFGGFGKSALTWQWFNNRVDKTKWQTAVWWSFYEKESGFESFLAETLSHLGLEVKTSARLQVNDLLEVLRRTNILIMLDGFERLLRQYGRMDAEIDPSQRDCSSPLTETFLRGLSGAGMKSKVLLTTRLCPRVLESADGSLLKGCREAPLAAFAPEDAVTYFHKEGIKARRDEIVALCAAYGYHPLSLSLLVGLINADHEKRGDIEAVKNLEIFEDVKARRHHVLERAYGSLAPERRELLSKMSCFRGSMEYAVLKKMFPSPDLDKSLLDLRQRGLLTYAGETQRYDMHPIVRHYVYDHLTAPDRTATHIRLRDYFVTMDVVKQPQTLDDLIPVIELYYHKVKAGEYESALEVFYDHLNELLYYQFGAYQTCIELQNILFDENGNLPNTFDYSIQGAILNNIGVAYGFLGQPNLSLSFIAASLKLDQKAMDINRYITGLSNLANHKIMVGHLQSAKNDMEFALKTFENLDEITTRLSPIENIKDEQIKYERMATDIVQANREVTLYQDYSYLLIYLGDWKTAQKILDESLKYFEPMDMHPLFKGINYAFRALCALQMARSTSEYIFVRFPIPLATKALELCEDGMREGFSIKREFIRSHWLLGSAYRVNNELTLAEENLFKALHLCRQINLVEMEADILLELAKLRHAQGQSAEALQLTQEALVITERSGYVLQGADVNLFLAELALIPSPLHPSPDGRGDGGEGEKERKALARKYAEEAKRLAYCDGPPYYYKVAYEEAERMLEKLK